MATNTVCPRCEHQIPNDATPGAFPGATSRLDSKIEICSACGTHEGLLQFAGEVLPGPEDWPVAVPADLYVVNNPERLAELKAQLDNAS